MSEKLTNTQTETERIYEDLANKADEEEPTGEEVTEVEDSQEDAKVAQAIADYSTKIEALDEQLATFQSDKLTDMKRTAMKDNRYSDDQVERYLTHIEGETAEEIKQSVFRLSDAIPPFKPYIDPSLMAGARQRPKSNKFERSYNRSKDTVRRLIKGGKIR